MPIKKIIRISFILVCICIVSAILFFYRRNKPLPNIIFITIDALRADHLDCYGYQRNTSPNIDKLSKEGVIFLNCFSTAPATTHSFLRILTGKYLSNDQEDMFLNNVLDEKFSTLSEYFKNFGYYTAAFVTTDALRIGRGFEQGFDYYKNYSYIPIGDTTRVVTTNVLNLLNNYQKSNKPFFIWIHYIGVHAPYNNSKKYFKIFENDTLYKKNDKILMLRPKDFYPQDRFYDCSSWGYIPLIAFQKDKYNLNYYIGCYDAEIRYTDFYIGELLKNIKDNTIIILSADHGESLGEHNVYFSHGENIYDELLHIPLIIKDNRYFKGGRKIPTIVSSVDIVPTILRRVNPIWYFFNKNKFNGIGLQYLINNEKIKRKYIYSYFCNEWSSIRDTKENIKYILCKDGKEELYFLPDEHTNHINDELPKVTHIKEKFREALKNWFKNYPIRADINSKKVSLDECTQNNLRSLGYLQ